MPWHRHRRPATVFDTSLVKLVGGVRVGIVGLTTPATPLLIDPARVPGLVRLAARGGAPRGEAAA
jgi:hypothetical protein